ncbi:MULTISPECIES: hypothetical protein [Protofrankia]|uniref:hypothetical protein n=1 Tax=Protofrankia TaxID=2994361 RepID=UPI001040FBB4|nr:MULTISPECIES: hypothetical protein [Protofrankia]
MDDFWQQHARVDEEDRAGRVERSRHVAAWLSGYDYGAHSGGEEAKIALTEAIYCYVYHLPLAAIASAHIFCERELAGLFGHLLNGQPKGWEHWGLGPLVDEAFRRDWISSDLAEDLRRLTAVRRGLGHFRRPTAPDSLFSRRLDFLPLPEFVDGSTILLHDAADALQSAFRLGYDRREGFWRMTPS